MSMTISRRTALGMAAAGIVGAAAGATSLASRGCEAARGADPAPRDVRVDYVDRDGWMLTPSEGQRVAR
jgi:hypothetical protein